MRRLSDVGAAVIGSGFIGTVHIEALRRIGVQLLLVQQGGIGLGAGIGKPQAGGEAVAEKHDRARVGGASREETEKEENDYREAKPDDAHGLKRPLKLAFVPFRVFCGQNLLCPSRRC